MHRDQFHFNEVTSLTGVRPYVLRFWESEFEEIAPHTTDNGHKIYTAEDIEAINKIKKYLYDDKLSIPKAKAKLMEDKRPVENFGQMQADGVPEFSDGFDDYPLPDEDFMPLPPPPFEMVEDAAEEQVIEREYALPVIPETVRSEAIHPEAIQPEALQPEAIELTAAPEPEAVEVAPQTPAPSLNREALLACREQLMGLLGELQAIQKRYHWL